MKTAVCLLFGLLVIVPAGCGQIPSNESMYDLAVSAVRKAAVSRGEKVRVEPFGKARVSVGKNGGWVELPVTYTASNGVTRYEVDVVWLKRVARTWTVEDIEPRKNLLTSQP